MTSRDANGSQASSGAPRGLSRRALGTLLILLATGITSVAIVVFVSTLRPTPFLGQHGVSAWRQGLELLARRRSHDLTSKAGDQGDLAPVGEVDSK